MTPFGVLLVPSRLHAVLVAGGAMLAGAGLGSAGLWWLLPLPFVLALRLLWLDGRLGGPPPRVLSVSAEGTLTLMAGGVRQVLTLSDRTRILPWLVMLHVRAAGRARCIPVWRDAVASGDWRALRVYLYWFDEGHARRRAERRNRA